MENTFSFKNSQLCIAVGFLALFFRCSSFFYAGQGPSPNRFVSLPRVTESGFVGVKTSSAVTTKVIKQILEYHILWMTLMRTLYPIS